MKRYLMPLGAGSFGEVWLVELTGPKQPPPGLRHAVKIGFSFHNQRSVQREFALLVQVASLHHPSIIQILDIMEVDGKFHVGMELANQDLFRWWQEQHHLDTQLGVALLIQHLADIADALDYIHSRGMIHGGVNPTDILFSGGKAKLTDFGVPITDREIGIPHYKLACMAPEAKIGQPGKESDQYALAATYAWIRLHHPIVPDIRNGEMELDLLSSRETEVLKVALCEDPCRRFPSCRAFVTALQDALSRRERCQESF